MDLIGNVKNPEKFLSILLQKQATEAPDFGSLSSQKLGGDSLQLLYLFYVDIYINLPYSILPLCFLEFGYNTATCCQHGSGITDPEKIFCRKFKSLLNDGNEISSIDSPLGKSLTTVALLAELGCQKIPPFFFNSASSAHGHQKLKSLVPTIAAIPDVIQWLIALHSEICPTSPRASSAIRLSTIMSSLSHRRCLSEGNHFNILPLMKNDSAFTLLPNEIVEICHPFVLGKETFAALEQRSKSESFICTAQGIVFQDTKCQKYKSKLNSLVALASSSSSSQSNVLLAKKALRYRKVLERHRVMAKGN